MAKYIISFLLLLLLASCIGKQDTGFKDYVLNNELSGLWVNAKGEHIGIIIPKDGSLVVCTESCDTVRPFILNNQAFYIQEQDSILLDFSSSTLTININPKKRGALGKISQHSNTYHKAISMNELNKLAIIDENEILSIMKPYSCWETFDSASSIGTTMFFYENYLSEPTALNYADNAYSYYNFRPNKLNKKCDAVDCQKRIRAFRAYSAHEGKQFFRIGKYWFFDIKIENPLTDDCTGSAIRSQNYTGIIEEVSPQELRFLYFNSKIGTKKFKKQLNPLLEREAQLDSLAIMSIDSSFAFKHKVREKAEALCKEAAISNYEYFLE